ncbi:STAS domain-containing protein [Aestuariibacter salexigens]|uniref:STAS domain-containing protein n=1 Tax=Aestuariibacter salexigens TaxID=226010 RepID=UPI00041F4D54|nr:STAS domain-containing protein [Aestuariibacter salexigens]
MSKKSQTDDEKLGHDPLEWLAEESVMDEDARLQETSSDGDLEPQEPSEDMPDRVDENGAEQLSYPLPERLTVQVVEAMQQELSALLGNAGLRELSLDAQNLSMLDSCGYQLLVSVLKTCHARQVKIKLHDVQEAVLSQLLLLGDHDLSAIQGEV